MDLGFVPAHSAHSKRNQSTPNPKWLIKLQKLQTFSLNITYNECHWKPLTFLATKMPWKTRRWTELACHGNPPPPRSGHQAFAKDGFLRPQKSGPKSVRKLPPKHMEFINVSGLDGFWRLTKPPQNLLIFFFDKFLDNFEADSNWGDTRVVCVDSRDTCSDFNHGLHSKREEHALQPTEVVYTSLEAGTMNSNSTISSCWTSRTRCSCRCRWHAFLCSLLLETTMTSPIMVRTHLSLSLSRYP